MYTDRATRTSTGTAEELLLRGERYRDAFGRNESENLPFLAGNDDNADDNDSDEEGTARSPSRQTFLQRWGLRRPAWMSLRNQQQRQYQPIDARADNEDDASDATTDVEADFGVDDTVYGYSDDPTTRARNKQRRRDRDAGVGSEATAHETDADGEGDVDADTENTKNRRIAGATWHQAKTPGSVIGLVAVLLFFLVFAACMALVPMMRLVEDAICRRYYGLNYGDDAPTGNSTHSFNTHKEFLDNDYGAGFNANGTDERLCKVDAVQAELAWLGGVVSVTEAIFGLLASFPWALLSDRIGRKPVFRISFVGVALSFGWTSLVLLNRDVLSVWWVLTSEILLLVGGGAGVTVTILHSIVADVSVSDRASGFIWLAIGAVAGSIVGPACAAVLMMTGGENGEGRSAWVPITITLFIVAPIILLLTVFLPETLPKKAASSSPPITSSTSTISSSPSNSFWFGTIPAHMRETFKQLQKTVVIMRRSRSSLLILPSYLFTPAIQNVQGGILAQSVSKRFGWSLAQTGYLFSFKGIVTVVVLALIPAISKYILMGNKDKDNKNRKKRCCTGLGMSETGKDLFLARTSLACLVLGNILMAASTYFSTLVLGMVLSTLAVGFGSMTRSLITHYFVAEAERAPTEGREGSGTNPASNGKDKDDHTSRLYTLTNMVETAGSVLAGPLLAWTFSAGLSLGGVFVGLPFYYVAILCVIALICLVIIRDDGDEAKTDGRIRLSTTSDRHADSFDDENRPVGSGQIALP